MEEIRDWCRDNHEWVRQHYFPERPRLFSSLQLEGHATLQQLHPADWDALAELLADLSGQLVQSRMQQPYVTMSTALLQRAQALLGVPPQQNGDPQSQLLQLLRSLYRAQTRLDRAQLRKLGHDCLQALTAEQALRDQLHAAARALTQLS